MILLTLSRGKGEETVRLQLPASPAEIGEAFASLDRISLDTTATAILDVSSNVPVLYRCLYDVDVEDSEQFQNYKNWRNAQRHFLRRKPPSFPGHWMRSVSGTWRGPLLWRTGWMSICSSTMCRLIQNWASTL